MKRLVPPDMRSCFTVKGDRKRKYSEREARNMAVRYHQEAYRCPQCGGWHLASLDKPAPH
jgi:hypothetical protein